MREGPRDGPPKTAREVLRTGVSRLREAGIEGAERDARLLLAAAMEIAPDRLTLHMDDPPTPEQTRLYRRWILDRKGRMPVSKILCRRQFWGRWFEVTRDTLDPRPETETLIAEALEWPFTRVLDLGTGTGILAISLLAERPDAVGIAADVSAEALTVAGRNAARHGVADRLGIVESDWFDAVGGTFDLIVSNPPYVAASEMAGLAPEVRDHDPALALTDGADGLAAYARIAAGASAHLTPQGRLLVEIGAGQGRAVAAIFRVAGLDVTGIRSDLDGRNRVVSAQKPQKSAE